MTNETVLWSMLHSFRHVRFVSGTVQGLGADPGEPQSIESVRYRPSDKDGSTLQAGNLFLSQRCYLGASLINSRLTPIHI